MTIGLWATSHYNEWIVPSSTSCWLESSKSPPSNHHTTTSTTTPTPSPMGTKFWFHTRAVHYMSYMNALSIQWYMMCLKFIWYEQNLIYRITNDACFLLYNSWSFTRFWYINHHQFPLVTVRNNKAIYSGVWRRCRGPRSLCICSARSVFFREVEVESVTWALCFIARDCA